MLKVLKYTVLTALCPLVSMANVDWVVIPFLKKGGYHGCMLYVLACACASIELCYWYAFWGMFAAWTEHKKDHKNKIIQFFKNRYHWATNDSNHIVRWIKRGGYYGLFFIGIFENRTIPVAFCRSLKWRQGFYILAMANIIHTCAVVFGWSLIIAWLQSFLRWLLHV